MLQGKHVIVGVTGGIAAYKAVYLVRELVRHGADVHCLMTEGARHFVGPVSLAAISGHPVPRSGWELSSGGEVGHVELAQQVDAIVVAPATADFISRVAQGRADDPLSLVVLDSPAPVLLAPAMEEHMYVSPQQRAQLEALLSHERFSAVGPAPGALASGRQGLGRMSEPAEILLALQALLSPHDLVGRRVVVTAGGTREHVDPVRFIGNPSTGRMGVAMATAAWRRGASVTLIGANLSCDVPSVLPVEPVTSTADMLAAVRAAMTDDATLVMAAAPADMRPSERAPEKRKKADLAATLALEPTADILTTMRAEFPRASLIGFAAETTDMETNARAKLAAKGLAAIVANDVSGEGIGFASSDNAVTVYRRAGEPVVLARRAKDAIADAIWDVVLVAT